MLTAETPVYIDEDTLVQRAAAWLREQGFDVSRAVGITEKGIDIVASRNGETWLIEAKGQTSAKGLRRGRLFTRAQILTRVSRALYTASKLSSAGTPNTRVLMALPDDGTFVGYVEAIRPALRKLQIGVIWVGVNSADCRQEL